MVPKVKSSNELKVYEHNGKEQQFTERPLKVTSHWNRDEFVIIDTGTETFTVLGDALRIAIDNAMNVE